MSYLFEGVIVVDEQQQYVPYAVGQLYSKSDASFATPLAVTDPAGVPILNLTAGPLGQLPALLLPEWIAVWKSGPYTQVVWSPDALVAAAEASQMHSAESAAAAQAALARSFKIGRPTAGEPPTWWGSFTAATAPTLADGVRVGDEGVLLP